MSERDTPAGAAPELPSDPAGTAIGSSRPGSADPPSIGVETPLNPASKGGEGPPRAAGADDPLRAIIDGDREPPVFCRLGDREVAIVDVAVYRELLKAAGRASFGVARPADRPSRRKPRPVSTIERDGEVAEFLCSRFRGGVTVAQVRDACRDAFGEDRTPSHQRIQRFRHALRQYR